MKRDNKGRFKKGRKLFFFIPLLFIFLFLPIISANFGFNDLDKPFGVIKSQECINLVQTCSNCTYVNISSILYFNSSEALSQVQMTKSGTEYNYTFCNNIIDGTYYVNGFGDNNGQIEIFRYFYEVNPSGRENINSNIILFLVLIVLTYTITFVSFFGKNIPLSILCGMFMMSLGLYIIRNGLIIYIDWITRYFSYVTIAIGFSIAIWAALEQLDIL